MNKHLRLRMLTLFSLLFFFSVSLFAQEKLVTIHLENVSLREIFSAIEKQTTYRFSYRNVVIDATKDIISQTKVPVSSVLNEALAGKNLEYNIVSSKSIVISDRPKKTASDQKEISGIINVRLFIINPEHTATMEIAYTFDQSFLPELIDQLSKKYYI